MRFPKGQGFSGTGGAQSFQAKQMGFTAKITSAYSTQTGYDWERLVLTPITGVTTSSIPETGKFAYAIDGDQTIAVDTRVWLEPDPNAQGWIITNSAGAGGGNGALCRDNGSGWMVDKQALIDRFSDNIPKGVLSYEIYSGAIDSRCECIPHQYHELAEQPYDGVAHAFYVAGTDTWDGTRLIASCCSCGVIQFEIPDNDGTADHWQPITGTLTMHAACNAGATTYVLRYDPKCSEAGVAVFHAAGPTLCTDDPAPVPCDNSFTVVVRCDDCTYENVACTQCSEICAGQLQGPAVFRITTSGFTGGDAEYNGPNGWWDLWPSNDCEWSITCGGITVTLTLTPTGTNDTTEMTVTFTGAANSAVFRYTSPEIIAGVGTNATCFTQHTAGWVSGNDPTQPADVTVTPIYCEACEDSCPTVDYANMTATILSATGDCDCAAIAFASSGPNFQTTFGLTGCANNVQLVVRCEGGRVRVDVAGSSSQSFAEVSLAFDPFEWVVDLTFAGPPGAPLDPCGGTIRIAFSAPNV